MLDYVSAYNETATALDTAADLITPDGAWTTGVIARNRDGCEVMPSDKYAVCWCVMGAIQRAADLHGLSDYQKDTMIDLTNERCVADMLCPDSWSEYDGTEACVQTNDKGGHGQAVMVRILRDAARDARHCASQIDD